MNYSEKKALDAYITGSTVVREEDAPAVMKELENHNGTYYDDIRMNGLVSIEKG
ncbi:hypothetical protein QTG56_24535 (plasmid) [Rossellomorea sp. AcN35-11]|nr:hypothetical protein [Rossellomorea aquimaris]WJV31803.1 hypothetical protein QTG56_24535 [Rossellomorea sp. AcN35-11]